ncbi:SDR family NAD(P)-dependent oxidoreductase [Frankia sp. Cr1]|uniref:SDR family NAD(P)-dependent oxidoreductase n=1 Tax=Frankia sp. Cr1 TaxID=3073931 RepID=UPI002AD2F0E7|nr:SDR family NAD(P)-dependent oxidoreductase [Frankia sp. Cr1]
MLSGRDAARLDAVRADVQRHTGAVAEAVVADLATEDGVQALLIQLKGRDVDVLVNNAGFGTYGRFAQVPAEHESALIAVDITAVVRLTHELLPGMRARGRGRILNVASTIAFQPAPYQAVYGGAKAFVLSFSQALAEETRDSGVIVTALCPASPAPASSTPSALTSPQPRSSESSPIPDRSSMPACGGSTAANGSSAGIAPRIGVSVDGDTGSRSFTVRRRRMWLCRTPVRSSARQR